MKSGTKITVGCTAVVVASAGALALRSAWSHRQAKIPVRVERAAFPSAMSMQADLRGAGFETIGQSEFVAADGKTWQSAVFHHPRAGSVTLTTLGSGVNVLRVDADYVPTERSLSASRLLEQWLPGVLDVVDVLQSAPYEGTPISVIGRRRFYLWLTLGPMNGTSESRRMQLELRTPTGQETFIEMGRAASSAPLRQSGADE